ncbi:major facilitator superfamily domain-containing protein [Aspergillus crustosus]
MIGPSAGKAKQDASTDIPDDIILISWKDDQDPENPYNWSPAQKWLLTSLATLATFLSMVNGTIITVAHEEINTEFNISDAAFPHSYWPVTSWAVGGACSALLILPLMEDFGVRPLFLGTYATLICFVVPTAVAQSFATLVVTRFFCGACVAVLANTSATVIGNIWASEQQRSIPVSMYILAYLAGSSIGPVIGASIYEHLGWRWIGYMQLIWYGAFLPVFFFLLKESRGAVILAQRARALQASGKRAYTQEEFVHHKKRKSVASQVARSAARPLVLFFTEPVLFVSVLWSGFTVGALFLFTQSVEQVFVSLYAWNATQSGYVQSSIVVGECIGWVVNLLSASLYFASARRNTEIPGTPIPETRLYLAVAGGIIGMSGGMFVYGWTSYPYLPWIAPAIGLAMVGAGSMLVVTGVSDYITDAYSMYAGSAFGAVAAMENIFSAFFPLATQSLYGTLGLNWASTLLALVCFVLSLAPILMFIWGKEIRARSPYIREAMKERRAEDA